MEKITHIEVSELKKKMLVQLTGEELVTLIKYAVGTAENDTNSGTNKRTLAYGVEELANALGCSPSKIHGLMRTPRNEDGSAEHGGILRDAIVSRIGRKIVYDTERARELANKYSKNL